MKILVTGVAGFIGAAVAKRLLAEGHAVIGVDNLNAYYDPALKMARLKDIGPQLKFHRLNLEDESEISRLFRDERPEVVINLAAQAGVRYSLENPAAYARSNLVGFLNVLEGCRQNGVGHLVFASSSSVYGLNSEVPFREDRPADHPASLYAATKKSNELMAHAYAHLFGFPCTGLRFFTVYGPWGRPDMAPFLFADAILHGRPIKVFNNGDMERDFTYIDDVVAVVCAAALRPACPTSAGGFETNPSVSSAPWRIYNVGNSHPVRLADFIAEIERATGRKAVEELLPMQPGDVVRTFADTSAAERDFGFAPATPLSRGINETVKWFRSFYKL